MYTLFQVMTGDSWSMEIGRKVMLENPGPTQMLFVIYIFLTTFGLMNIVVGVIVENTLYLSKENDDLARRRREKIESRIFDSLYDIFMEADNEGDGNGFLSLEEFIDMLKDKKVRQKFEFLNIPVDNPRELFALFEQNEDGEVPFKEFFAGIKRIQGAASSKDMIA